MPGATMQGPPAGPGAAGLSPDQAGQAAGYMAGGPWGAGPPPPSNPYYHNPHGAAPWQPQAAGSGYGGPAPHAGMHAGQPPADANVPRPAAPPQAGNPWWSGLGNERFLGGVLVGAAAAYLLTNEAAQRTMIKAGVKLFGTVAGGVEELKERVMDAKAEMDESAMDESAASSTSQDE